MPTFERIIGERSAQLPTVAWLGDSIPAAYASQDTSLVTANYAYSPVTAVQKQMFHRIRTPREYVFATAGHTTRNALARIQQVLDCPAPIVIVNCVTNDIGSLSFDETKSNLRAIWKKLTDAGKIVIQVAVLSRGLSTAANRDAMFQLMDWFKRERQVGRPNLHIVDVNREWIDPASADAAPKTYYSYDDLHPRGLGAHYYAKPIVNVLNQILPPLLDDGIVSAADVWSATNPTGNLLPNGMLSGSSAISGSGGPTFSGTQPDNVTISATAGTGGTITSITVAGSTVAMANGFDGYQIVIGGTGTGSSASPGGGVLITQTVTSLSTKLSVGDVVESGVGRVEVDAGIVNLAGVRLRMRSTEAGSSYDRYDAWDTIADLLPSEAHAVGLLTPTRTLGAIPSLLSSAIWIPFRNQSAASFTGTIRVSNHYLRKVIA